MAISDLTGTTWVFNDRLNGWGEENWYDFENISYKSNGNTYSVLRITDDYDTEIYSMYYGDGNEVWSSTGWVNSAYKKIEFVSGSDLTNATLIEFMEMNATQQSTAPSYTFDLSSLSLASGTHTITAKAKATGYADSQASNEVSYTVSGGYTVEVSGTVDYSGEIVFYDGQNDQGTLLYDTGRDDNTFDESLVITSGYLYVYYAGSQTTIHGTPSAGISLVSSSSGEALYSVGANGTISGFYNSNCFVEGTLITLADGTKKPVEEVKYDDELLVWNFYEGKFDSAKPMWIMPKKVAHSYNVVIFENGAVLKLVGSDGYHRIYNDQAKEFTHTGTADTPNGTVTFTEEGVPTMVVGQEVVKGTVNYYNIITEKHYNLFAEGILTSCRLSNRYAIEDMRYDTNKVNMTENEVKEYIAKLR